MSTERGIELGVGDADVAIRARNVGKRYDIYSRTLHRLAHAFTGDAKFAREFWALRGVSFEVQRGEAVGIVGRNGSGKSTLMQIIAGTLAPTEGEVAIRGRISALLELGSGFNPQFTGRENVYLAGSILGLSRREMNDRFDAIAAFADIGEFLDQPVEVYSSGMHARLAFSVAVCVEPDVLIVDEILSVGDAGFQQKCLSRMRRSVEAGMTLLLVSHSADMVKSICTRALFLQKGREVSFGPAAESVDLYMQSLREETTAIGVQNAARSTPEIAQAINGATPGAEIIDDPSGLRYGTGHARIESVRLLDEAGLPRDGFTFGDTIVAEIGIQAKIDIARTDLVFVVRDKAGVDIFGSTVIDEGAWIGPLKAGERRLIRLSFASPLAPGPHGLALTLMRRPDVRGEGVVTLDHMDAAAAFESVGADRVVRGKLHIPVKAEIVVLAPAAV
ncbi:MAG TPA: ABC transporter ATP-binding protein [Phycisphaerales bacterium]|nr:ABC transporter ATP-binding protein [Phycisphaerales bacterium]